MTTETVFKYVPTDDVISGASRITATDDLQYILLSPNPKRPNPAMLTNGVTLTVINISNVLTSTIIDNSYSLLLYKNSTDLVVEKITNDTLTSVKQISLPSSSINDFNRNNIYIAATNSFALIANATTIYKVDLNLENYGILDAYFDNSTSSNITGITLNRKFMNVQTYAVSTESGVNLYNEGGALLNTVPIEPIFNATDSNAPICLNGHILAIGNYSNSTIKIFDVSTATAQEVQTLNGIAESQFGNSVFMNGNYLIGGGMTYPSGVNKGYAGVYVYDNSLNRYVDTENYVYGVNANDVIGFSCAISSDGLKAYVFSLENSKPYNFNLVELTVTSITFPQASVDSTIGSTINTQIATSNSDAQITYTSSNTAVASVDAISGVVTVFGYGTATITASQPYNMSYSEATATYSINVAKPLPTVTFSGYNTEYFVGDSLSLEVTSYAGAIVLFGTSSGTSSITSDQLGKATYEISFNVEGSYNLNIQIQESNSYQAYSTTITFNVRKVASSISPLYTNLSVSINDTVNLNEYFTPTPAGSTMIYKVNSTVVSPNYTFSSLGNIIVEASIASSPTLEQSSAQITFNVTRIQTTITTPFTTITRSPGSDSFNINASSNSTGTLSYSSNDTNVCTVDSNGQITIVGLGMCNIIISVPETPTHSSATKTLTINVAEISADTPILVTNGDELIAIFNGSEATTIEIATDLTITELLSNNTDTTKSITNTGGELVSIVYDPSD